MNTEIDTFRRLCRVPYRQVYAELNDLEHGPECASLVESFLNERGWKLEEFISVTFDTLQINGKYAGTDRETFVQVTTRFYRLQ